MNYQEAIRILAVARNPESHSAPISWVSPIVSTVCAASSASREIVDKFQFVEEAYLYASTNGLLDALAVRYQKPDTTGQQGQTYTKLSRLRYGHEIDFCNSVIADLFYSQLGNNRSVTELVKVVGELHDNVASHANGQGYSCAQVYKYGGERRIEFAVVDSGCGMLENVRRVVKGIDDDEQAIRWCLKKGNTSAGGLDPWAQRVPEDALSSPIPGPIYRDEGGNHHAGLGLYHLRRLIRQFGGKLWIWSGNSQIIMNKGAVQAVLSGIGPWHGVAIEFEIVVPEGIIDRVQDTPELEELAKRIGL